MISTPEPRRLPEFLHQNSRTRIVCTVGPTSEEPAVLSQMILNGMSVARINLAHGSPAEHRRRISAVRTVAKKLGVHIGILLDLPGPKYRLGKVEDGGCTLAVGDDLLLTERSPPNRRGCFSYHPAGLAADVSVGTTIIVDDGSVKATVEKTGRDQVRSVVTSGGVLKSNKTLSTPGRRASLDYLTSETVAGIELAQSEKVEFAGLSCVRDVDDVLRVRDVFGTGFTPQLVSKIERVQALENLDRMIDASDALMVARGDLGIEVELSEVPGIQKRIILAANQAGKPVITATQMLESMIELPQPTRAEMADIHNAVMDGTDAVMLSGETAIGKYPAKAVWYMREAALKAEDKLAHVQIATRRFGNLDTKVAIDDAIAFSAIRIAKDVGAKAIIAFTHSGVTAKRLSAFRPHVPLLAVYHTGSMKHSLSLCWGIVSLPFHEMPSINLLFHMASLIAESNGYATKGDLVVAVAGIPVGISGNTNLVRVISVPEPAVSGTP